MTQTLENKISARIYGNGRGWAFSQKDFVDLAKTPTIHWALYELAQADTIRRVLRGIYDYPRHSKLLEQTMPPDLHQVAMALARKFGWRIQPGGAAALNLLDLSTQVPGRIEYLSDGPDREYKVGNTGLRFRHQALKDAGLKHEASAVLVQGLKELGANGVTEKVIARMRDWLPSGKRAQVLRDAKGATDWVYDALKQICREENDG
ncbi:MAG: hypothetical protein JJU29_03430 [Verrucomicrobia bacterium]|nr:hypothetical protein [Verrucomicrobiota bacterium]MCH8512548.1 DUF6088 family protein [Kiritimatiellia bacterium]